MEITFFTVAVDRFAVTLARLLDFPAFAFVLRLASQVCRKNGPVNLAPLQNLRKS
jgi:hypothetical protein